MSDFKAKMHQNRFRLGLRSIPRWGSLQRSPMGGREEVRREGSVVGRKGGEGVEGKEREGMEERKSYMYL